MTLAVLLSVRFRIVLVEGWSMQPAIARWDLAVVVRSPCRCELGDVTLFTDRGGAPVLHRIVGIDRDGRFVTRGDANDVADSDRVGQEVVEGRVVFVVPLSRVRLLFAGREP